MRILERAPWLGDGLSSEERRQATRLLVAPVMTVRAGPLTLTGAEKAAGIIVLSGLIAIQLQVDRHAGMILVGPGDFSRPWDFEDGSSIEQSANRLVLDDCELALLDSRFWMAAARWPRLAENVVDRVVWRARANLFLMAIRHATRLEERLLLALWHLAETYGHVNTEGVVVDLPNVTHILLADLVAARRPSVTSALSRLRELGLVECREHGRWVLHGDPSCGVEQLLEGALEGSRAAAD